MEYPDNDPPTPSFGNYEESKTLFEEVLKKITKSADDVSQYVKNKEKHKNHKKRKSQSKEKKKSKEKSKSRRKSSKPKNKKISGRTAPVNQNYENPFDIFLQKKIKLRNDFDQNNSEFFLSEKEIAFQKFQLDEDADYLDD